MSINFFAVDSDDSIKDFDYATNMGGVVIDEMQEGNVHVVLFDLSDREYFEYFEAEYFIYRSIGEKEEYAEIYFSELLDLLNIDNPLRELEDGEYYTIEELEEIDYTGILKLALKA